MPDGYKVSDAGVIPEDWEVSSVASEFDIQLGKMLDAARNIGTRRQYIGNRAVQWGRINTEDLPSVALTPADLQRYRLQVGDLLVCEGGEVGRAAIWTDPILECYYQKALHRLRAKRDYDATFLMYLLQLWAPAGRLANYVTQTSIAHLTKEKLGQLPIPVPDRREQGAIARALLDVDDLTAALDRLIAKKRDVMQGATQALVSGERRLAGFSEIWATFRLGDVATVVTGGTPSTQVERYWGGGIPWCTPTDITSTRARYLRATERTLTEAGLRASSATLLPAGALLLCTRATIGELKIADVPIATNQGFKSLVCVPGINSEFLYYKLLTMKRALVERGSGSTFLEVGKKDVEALEIDIPEEDEQTAVARVLADMDDEIAALERRRQKVALLKQGMLEQLLSGRIRFSDKVDA